MDIVSLNAAMSAKKTAIVGDEVLDSRLKDQLNALAPYSGYTSVSKKLDNFVFKEDANFTYSVADKNRFVKFGDRVVDTYGEELVTNGDFSGSEELWLSRLGGNTLTYENNTLIVTG